MWFLRDLDVLDTNSSPTKTGGKTYTDEKWRDCDLARSIAVDWHSSTRLEILLWYLHPAPARTRSAMAASSQGCFTVKILLYGNSLGKTWTWQCFIISCYFSWISFAFRCMRRKSLKPNYFYLTPENLRLHRTLTWRKEKGEYRMKRYFKTKERKKKYLLSRDNSQPRRKMSYLCPILWGHGGPSVLHIIYCSLNYSTNILSAYYILWPLPFTSP